MHELSIAQSILDTLQREQEERSLAVISDVTVRVGVMSGVLPESLRFCFDAIVRDTPFAGCALHIEEVPVRGICGSCGTSFELSTVAFQCPSCGDSHLSITAGFDLDIASFVAEAELDAAAAAPAAGV